MREIRPELIKAHARTRMRSEYDYALFEYYRSAKVIAFLEQAGIALGGSVLDVGCGGGGMPLSLAEHVTRAVGIDPQDRFSQAGAKLARERSVGNLRFVQADGMRLPFATDVFDLVLSHAVIEHVADAPLYLRECHRVMQPCGRMYLSTAPYLSFAGAHLPRLLVPVPLHLLIGRRAAFGAFRWLARHAAWTLKEPAHENSFIREAKRGIVKKDDLLEKVRMRRLRRLMNEAGFDVVQEHISAVGSLRRLPRGLSRWLTENRLTQDIVISSVEYILAPR